MYVKVKREKKKSDFYDRTGILKDKKKKLLFCIFFNVANVFNLCIILLPSPPPVTPKVVFISFRSPFLYILYIYINMPIDL